MTALWRLSAHQLTEGFGRGAFTPTEALHACLSRCEAVNPRLNALVATDLQTAFAAAEASDARWRDGRPLGPLDGVPTTIKDNLHVRGLPTHWGSRALEGFIPGEDEQPVARLRRAGAVIFGKTNVPEFTMQGYTDNPVFGPTGNPWNVSLTPGGSSGGAAALVAAGGCPVALGTDGGGSIRRPASHTGLIGLKPSRGRVPRSAGLPAISLEYEVVGALTRCVQDAAAVLEAIGHAVPRAGHLEHSRILYLPRFGDSPVDRSIRHLTNDAADRLARMGHRVEAGSAPAEIEAVNSLWPLLSQVGLAWLNRHSGLLGPAFDIRRFGDAMKVNAEKGAAASAVDLFELHMAVVALGAKMDEIFETHDFILTPAAAALPWPAAESHPPIIDGHPVGPRGHAVFTAFANAAGLPGISVPCGFASGLPVGLQLVTREGGDDRLLALAAAFERQNPEYRFPEP